MSEGYWKTQSISRRRALQNTAAGGAGLAALSLVGCGSDGEEKGEGGAPEAVTDSTKGVPGGKFVWALAGFPGSFSVITTPNIYTTAGPCHSALLANAWGQESVDQYDYLSLEPDLAVALPEQTDDLTYIYKLRPGVRFHNGRTLTSEDVKYSYDKYATLDRSIYRETFAAWLDRVETPDPQTVVIKSKFPFGEVVISTAGNQYGFVLAKEHDETADANNRYMGAGPWIFVDATPPVSIRYRKNPDYYLKPYPYFDELQAVGYA